MRVSIIIVTWNALPLIRQCLPSVVATSYPDLEIIVADNASSDGTAEWVRSNYPDVIIVRHPDNWFFCRGNNEAVPHATGNVIVFLNNDVEVPSNWLNPLVAAFSDPSVGVVQPKLLQYTDRNRFEYAGASGGFLDRFGYPFTRGRIFFDMEMDTGQYDDACDVFWASGAAMVVRREVLNEVGLFDEHFVMHMEEIDLCWRIQRAGWRVRVIPQSTVYHVGGGSLPQGNPRKTYYNFRNNLLLLYKNMNPADFQRIFPIRASLDFAAVGRAIAKRQIAEARAIIRALADAHRMKQRYDDQRPATSAIRLPYRRSIVFDYFLRGRKSFSTLPSDSFQPSVDTAGGR